MKFNGSHNGMSKTKIPANGMDISEDVKFDNGAPTKVAA